MSPSFDYYDNITENSSWLTENSNIKVPDSKSGNNTYNTVYRNA